VFQVLLAVSAATAATMAGDRYDQDLERRVKLRVEGSPELTGARLETEVSERRVRIRGRVPTLAQAWEAEREAGRIYGVLDVDVQLEIATAGRRDSSVEAGILSALRDLVLAGPVPIEIDVTNGLVRLEGRLSRASGRMRLRQAVARVPGVLGIEDELTTGEVEDEVLAARLQRVFARRGRVLVAGEIVPDVREGAVTLSGTVPRHYERIVATELAFAVEGVRSVELRLEVVPPPMEVPVVRP
jgi:osmotically-inducible protein OsmY